jgi:hypothetical protein
MVEFFESKQHIRSDCKLIQKYADRIAIDPELREKTSTELKRIIFGEQLEDGTIKRYRPREIAAAVTAYTALEKLNLQGRQVQAQEDQIVATNEQGSHHDQLRELRMKAENEQDFYILLERLAKGNGHARPLGDNGE